MEIFQRLLKYVLRHVPRMAAVFALALVGAGVELARPWPMQLVVDHVLAGRSLPGILAGVAAFLPGAATTTGMLVWCVVAALVIVIAGGVLSLAVMNMGVRLAQLLVYDLVCDLFSRLQRLSLAYHGKHSVGDLLQRISSDVYVVNYAVTQVLLPGSISLLILVGMFVIMARLDLTLTLIALGVVPLLALALGYFAGRINDTTSRQWERQGSLMAFVEQSLSAMKVIQGFAREAFIMNRLRKEARDLGEAFTTATRVSSAYKEVTGIITGLASAVLLGIGALHVVAGKLSLGGLLVFLGYLAALYGPVNALSSAVGYAVAVVARGRRVFEVLDSREEVMERSEPLPLGQVRGEVEFEDISFAYDGRGAGSRLTLDHISFRTGPGEVIAIVGPTGAGKTTLVSLLSRFYDPQGGRILLDGIDIRDLALKSLRENVSLVLQEPFLFPLSVADNIAFGRPEASREDIEAAAVAAQAHDFIRRLPQGYDTPIGAKGQSLSGGERQRIAIARAILKDAPVLILDEPTSAVDARTETMIFEAVSRLVRNTTTFVISHRLTTIRRAGQIVVLDGGRIVERGTHDDLLALGGLYKQLYKHQHIAYV